MRAIHPDCSEKHGLKAIDEHTTNKYPVCCLPFCCLCIDAGTCILFYHTLYVSIITYYIYAYDSPNVAILRGDNYDQPCNFRVHTPSSNKPIFICECSPKTSTQWNYRTTIAIRANKTKRIKKALFTNCALQTVEIMNKSSETLAYARHMPDLFLCNFH